MINYSYDLYVEKTIGLAETMVVKFEDAARAINLQVIGTYGFSSVDEYDQSSWKYYQNISGTYHFSDLDENGKPKIKIASLDTGETIYFTKEALAIHTSTLEAYRYGSRYYRELIMRYPDMEMLIRGVLYPSDIDLAIVSKDGTILSYPKELVESNEYGLIDKIQNWTYNYLDRWVNRQFTISDDLYVATYIGQYFLHLIQAIFAFRLAACKTNEVHSFHVKQYLASHNFLDEYFPYLTQHQALFLYRNIRYIQRHAGKREVFDLLVENLFTHRRLPLYEYRCIHDVGRMQNGTDIQNRYLLPDVVFKRNPLNLPAKRNTLSICAFEDVLKMMDDYAPGNATYRVEKQNQILDTLIHSPSGTNTTKLLESQIDDYGLSSTYSLDDILLTHWIALSLKGYYVVNFELVAQKNGALLKLNTKEAVGVMMYCLYRANQLTENTADDLLAFTVPEIQLDRVIRDTVPSLREMKSIVDNESLDNSDIEAILSTAVLPKRINSAKEFYRFAISIHSAARQHQLWYSSKQKYLSRGYAKNIASHLYKDELIAFTDSENRAETYGSLLSRLGIDLSEYTQNDFYVLANAILYKAVGGEYSTSTDFKRMHDKMASLFMKLCSYSITLINNHNQSDVQIAMNHDIRLNDAFIEQKQNDYVEVSTSRIIGMSNKEYQKIQGTHGNMTRHSIAQTNVANVFKQDITLQVINLRNSMTLTPRLIAVPLTMRTDFNFDRSAKMLSTDQRRALKQPQ